MRAPMPWRGGGPCGRAGSMPDLVPRLRAVLPPGMVLGVGDLQCPAPLWPGEDLPAAVPKRVTEFAAGRQAARAALTALHWPLMAIPMAADRSPIWPTGIAASISHCDGACLAVAGRAADFAGIGLDLEPARPLPEALWPSILGPAEAAAQGLQALKIFVAKEAAYKAQFPLSQQVFDFQALIIYFDDQRFMAEFTTDVPPFAKGDQLTGRMVMTDRFCAALCWIAAGAIG